MALTDRASLLRKFFRLVDSDSADDDLIEHDNSTLEGAYELLNDGARMAQDYIIQIGGGGFWATTASLSSWSSDSFEHQSATLPSDFMRALGDEDDSALRKANGEPWGREIDFEDRLRVRGDYYYFSENKIWVAKDANLPSAGLTLHYIAEIDALADSTDADMRADLRELIPAFAAVEATAESWYTGDQADEARLARHLKRQKHKAFKRIRRSDRPRKIRAKRTVGNHWFI